MATQTQTQTQAKDTQPKQAQGSSKLQALRARVLKNAPAPRRELLTLFGVEVELVQPTFGAIMSARDSEDASQRAAMMAIEYIVMPGTDERIFCDDDIDAIMKWPFSQDLVNLNTAIANLTGVDIQEAKEEIKKDPLDEES